MLDIKAGKVCGGNDQKNQAEFSFLKESSEKICPAI